MADKKFLAADLGASNGRMMLGGFDGHKIVISEINRFSNEYCRVGDSYFWDILGLYSNILKGIKICAKNGGELSGIGIDTWGVDFGLIDAQGRIIGNPRAYRDPRGLRGMKAFLDRYGERTAFDITGIADWEYNTLYQLYDMKTTKDPQLGIANKMLLLPDLLGYMLCGGVSSEYTHATTTQMLDRHTRGWSKEILNMIGLSEDLMAPVQVSGSEKGRLFASIKEEAGLKSAPPVFCVGSHDTASAVASVPAGNENYAFISSGTWSLIGVVSDTAIVNDTFYKKKFSNEGTVDGKYRPVSNAMGLWIIQNCKKQWDKEENLIWDDIVGHAKSAPKFRSFIDMNDRVFFEAHDMTGKIQRYCSSTGQPVPETKGEIARTVYESMAMGYREAFNGLEELKGKRIDVLHIVGGGSQNAFLNRLTANAIGREVIAGPAEATAIGNLMVQVLASGEVADITEMREVIRDSFDVENLKPEDTDEWSQQFERYMEIKMTKEYKNR